MPKPLLDCDDHDNHDNDGTVTTPTRRQSTSRVGLAYMITCTVDSRDKALLSLCPHAAALFLLCRRAKRLI